MLKKITSFFRHHYHTRYHGIYRHAKQLFVFDIGLLTLAVLIFAAGLWFFFWKPGVANLIELSISLGGNRIKSGDEVRLTVDYTNHSKKLLTDVALSLRLPDGFVVDRTATPETVFSNNSTFTLSPLPPGGNGQATVTGHLWAIPQHDVNIIGTFSYKQEGSTEREQALTGFLLSLPESVLATHLTIATSTFPNTPLPFTYTIQNTGSATVENIQLDATGGTVTFDQTDAQTFSLAPQETKTLTGRLVLPSKTTGAVFAVTPTVLANNHPIVQTAAQTAINVITPQFNSQVQLSKPVAYLEPEQKIPVNVSWRSGSSYSLKKQRLILTPTLGVVDLKTTAQENNLKIEGDTLVADSSNRTALAGSKQGSGDTFQIILTLLPAFSVPDTINSFTLTPTFEGEDPSVPGQKFTEIGDAITIPLATDVNLKSEVRYYTTEGDQLGRGPLPPAVGETTKYWVFVKFTNTVNPLRDAAVSIVLPLGVEFTGRQSVTIGPELVYNPADETISWQYQLIPAESSTGLYFEVAVNPTPDQIGKNVTLIKQITLTATDDVVGKNFSLAGTPLTNALASNDRGANAGAAVVTK